MNVEWHICCYFLLCLWPLVCHLLSLLIIFFVNTWLKACIISHWSEPLPDWHGLTDNLAMIFVNHTREYLTQYHSCTSAVMLIYRFSKTFYQKVFFDEYKIMKYTSVCDSSVIMCRVGIRPLPKSSEHESSRQSLGWLAVKKYILMLSHPDHLCKPPAYF